jgi:hypothetical protein
LQQRKTLSRFIEKRGRYNFAFFYQNYPLSEIVADNATADLIASEIINFVNGKEFLGLSERYPVYRQLLSPTLKRHSFGATIS